MTGRRRSWRSRTRSVARPHDALATAGRRPRVGGGRARRGGRDVRAVRRTIGGGARRARSGPRDRSRAGAPAHPLRARTECAGDASARARAPRALLERGGLGAVVQALADPNEIVQRTALSVIGARPDAATVREVARILAQHDESWAVRVLAAQAMGRLGLRRARGSRRLTRSGARRRATRTPSVREAALRCARVVRRERGAPARAYDGRRPIPSPGCAKRQLGSLRLHDVGPSRSAPRARRLRASSPRART